MNPPRISLTAQETRSPKWQLLFPLGETRFRADFPGGKVTFDKKFCESLAANYAAEGKPERAINYFHRGTSQPGDVTPIDGKVAAGWISEVEFGDRGAGPGVYVLTTWTDRAREYIVSDELRYLSPEFTLGSTSKQTGKPQGPTLLGAALLNDPFLTELPQVAASENTKGKDTMDRKMICAALGLKETATDDEINAACKTMTDARAKLAEAPEKEPAVEPAKKEEAPVAKKDAPPAETPEKEPAAVAEVEKKMSENSLALSAAEAAVVKLSAEVKALTEAKNAAEVKAFFDKLTAEGKCVPAVRAGFEKLALSSGLESVQFLAAMPAVVAIGTEVGVSGEVGGQDKLKAANLRWNAALEKNGHGMAAFEATKIQLADDFKLLFGSDKLAI